MSHPDDVFAAFIDANPVPDVAVLEGGRPSAELFLSDLERRGTVMKTTEGRRIPPDFGDQPSRRLSAPPGRWLVAAAAFAAVLAVGGIWWAVTAGNRGPEPAQPPPEDTVGPEALTQAEAWLAALNAGDVESILAIAGSSQADVDDRRMYEYHAVFATSGRPSTTVHGCEIESANDRLAIVNCRVTLNDPVAAAVGLGELISPFTYFNDALTWQPFEGGDIGLVNRAYAEYLQLFRPAEYEAACSPLAYEPGSVVQNGGIALTGECAELQTPLSDAVADWVEQGRPQPAGDLEAEAVAAAELWMERLNSGDVEGLVEITGPLPTDADRHMFEYHAVFAAQGRPSTTVESCAAVSAAGSRVAVECDVVLSDPVAEALGVDRLVFPFSYLDGLLSWQPATGADITLINQAYAEYLQAYHAADYEIACALGANELGSVVYSRGVVLTGACAELQAPLSDAVAQWIRDGRPQPAQ